MDNVHLLFFVLLSVATASVQVNGFFRLWAGLGDGNDRPCMREMIDHSAFPAHLLLQSRFFFLKVPDNYKISPTVRCEFSVEPSSDGALACLCGLFG